MRIAAISNSLIWADFDETMPTFTQSQNPIAAAIAEIDSYLIEPYVPREIDPLKWCKSRAGS